VLGGLQAGVGLLLAGRMAYIAIAENERSELMAEENRVHLRLIPPGGGWIVDRNGHPIAANRSTFRVDLLPDRIDDPDQLLASSAIAPVEARGRAARPHRTRPRRRSQPVAVAENLSYEQYAALTLRQMELPGVSPLRSFSRHYPEAPPSVISSAMSALPIARNISPPKKTR
jgi:penicillin-binding protein 2